MKQTSSGPISDAFSRTLSHVFPTCQSLLAASLLFSVPLAFQVSLADQAAAQAPASQILKQDGFVKDASWELYDADTMARMLRSALDQLGITPDQMDLSADEFLDAIESRDQDPLDAYVDVSRSRVAVIDDLLRQSTDNIAEASQLIDPNTSIYAAIESLPKSMRMSVRTWLGRELVRARLYDEALPVIAEVDPTESIDPAAVLFYRGACYHSLLMKKEALADLRMLLENEEQAPVRFSRTAKMMIADIKPMKEDSLDEISRLMTDVSRRLDLGRSDEQTKDQEQKIIDKLTKLIEKIEEQQKQQQQQQGQSSGSPSDGQGGQGSPMQDSQAAGGGGNGDVDRKKIDDRDGWGNLPPAERQQALQQISRDLPTHYREAIEAYFRKLATEG